MSVSVAFGDDELEETTGDIASWVRAIAHCGGLIPRLNRRPAARKSPKDRSVSSDRIDTGTEKTGHTNPTRQRGTLAEASA